VADDLETYPMSIDSSLKMGGSGIVRHRNVLTRPEKIARLMSQGKFEMDGDAEQNDPLHLPKVGNRKIIAGKKKKVVKEEEDTKKKKKKK
jgi:small basic protein (TIGR04137 family)